MNCNYSTQYTNRVRRMHFIGGGLLVNCIGLLLDTVVYSYRGILAGHRLQSDVT